MTYIVVAFILAVLLFTIIWLVRRMLKNRVVHKKAIFTDEDDLSKSSSDLLQDAERAAREGRYNEAIRYRFLAILMAMDELGWVRAERWKTNFEYREELKEGRAGAISSFSKAARIFEKVYYGRAPAGQQQYAELSQYGEDCMRKGGRNDAAD